MRACVSLCGLRCFSARLALPPPPPLSSLSFSFVARSPYAPFFPLLVVVCRVTLSRVCRALYGFAFVRVCVCVSAFFFSISRNYFLAAHTTKNNNTPTQQHAHPRQAASLPLTEPRAAQHGRLRTKIGFVAVDFLNQPSSPTLFSHFRYLPSLPFPIRRKKAATPINTHHLHTAALRACRRKP